LDLPAAESVAQKYAVLDSSSAQWASTPTTLPAALPADRVPLETSIAEQQFSIQKIHSHEVCSRLIEVGDADAPALGLSISSGFSTPPKGDPIHRVLRFDAKSSKTEVVWKSNKRVHLLDHHPASGRSLVLIGHNPLGHGGQLAIATGWDRGALFMDHHRALPMSRQYGRAAHVRWARMIDEEHFLAVVDTTLIAANLVSGETLYRIDGLHKKSVPEISGGRRFVAVPIEGSVLLYHTADGESLGRIGTEPSVVPAVSFSLLGDSLAISTPRRMRIWSLPDAALRADIETRQSLGSGSPVWIDSDLVMSSSGVLLSIFRGVPVWRYDITGTVTNHVGANVAILRRYPRTKCVVVDLPHPGAQDAMKWIDAIPTATDSRQWQTPGKSVWGEDGWTDQNVRISIRPNEPAQR
jgi:hypothetical protein